MFETTIKLLDDYYRQSYSEAVPGFNRNLGSEVRKRLEQLDFIIGKVRHLEVDAAAPMARYHAEFEECARLTREYEGRANPPPLPPLAPPTKAEFKAHFDAQFEMELLTEAFYYFAGRIRTILRNGQTPLPGLQSFECPGVRNTRNKLMEHPEGRDSGVHMLSFGWGAPCGPVIKAIRLSEQVDVFPGKGLYQNAEEFRAKLEQTLQASLRRA
jgi:hypothetical protein